MNEKFEIIREYERDSPLKKLLEIQFTEHMKQQRQERYNIAISCLEENDYTEKIFVVDRGHPDGEEIHCITHSGIVFILNLKKYEDVPHEGLITVLIARVNQLERYGYTLSEHTKEKAILHENQGLNLV